MKHVKRFLTLFFSAILLIQATAIADEAMYNIAELKKITEPYWQQTYEAYGRTIDVDVKVEIPSASTFPMLSIAPILHSVPEGVLNQLEKRYTGVQDDSKHISTYYVNDDRTYVLWHYPFILDEKNGESTLTVTQPMRAENNYDLDTSYADNNPLTVREVIAVVASIIKEWYDDDKYFDQNFAISRISMIDRYYDKSTQEPIRDMGGYRLTFSQLFHGIPYVAQVGFIGSPTHLASDIISEDSYSINAYFLYQEHAVLIDDLPLCSFDKVKQTLEELIQQGQLRHIYKLQLAYVKYLDISDKSWVLLPAWVASSDCFRSAREEATEFDESALYFETSYYRDVIVSAQTGELISARSGILEGWEFVQGINDAKDCIPDVILWEDVSK